MLYKYLGVKPPRFHPGQYVGLAQGEVTRVVRPHPPQAHWER